MKLRTIIATALAVTAMTASAQTLQPTWNKPMGLQHKLKLSRNDIEALAKMQHKQAPNANTKVLSSANKSKLSKAARVSAMRKAAYASSDTLFFDSFESWDGQTWGWIDTKNWTRYSNCADYISEANSECPAWMFYSTDGYYAPYAVEGQNVAMLMNGYDVWNKDSTAIVNPAPDQNEWLVSKLVTTKVTDNNFLVFDLAYMPYTLHYFETYENGKHDSFIDKEKLAYDVEVLISKNQRQPSNSEAVYTSVWKLSEEVAPLFENLKSGDEINENNELMSFEWKHFEIPLKDFAGTNIRVAFRYKGKNGGTILLDNVRVSDLLPVAKYDIPAGAFYYGISMDGYGDQETPTCLVPANTPTVWKSKSNADAKTFEWATWNWGDKSVGEETTPNTYLTYGETSSVPGNVAEAYMPYPTLTVGAGNGRTNSYTRGGFVKFGGNTMVAAGSVQKQFGATNLDLTKQLWSPDISGSYGFGRPSTTFWSTFLDLTNSSFTGNVHGVGNLFEQPAAPYLLSTIWMPLLKFSSLSNTVRFTCEIYKAKIGEDGSYEITDQLIADASCTAKDVKDGKASPDAPYCLKFEFPNELTINEPIFVFVTGFNNRNLATIAPYAQALGHDSGNNYAFVALETKSGSFAMRSVSNMLTNADGVGNAETSFLMVMNTVFPYLYSTDGNEFVAKTEGETKTFNIDSYFNPDDWRIKTPEWVKCETILDEAEGKSSIKITADALPSVMPGREGEVVITSACNTMVINVSQGTVAKQELGDIDGDGKITVTDITMLIDNYLNDQFTETGDMDGDGSVSVSDITLLIDKYLTGN